MRATQVSMLLGGWVVGGRGGGGSGMHCINEWNGSRQPLALLTFMGCSQLGTGSGGFTLLNCHVLAVTGTQLLGKARPVAATADQEEELRHKLGRLLAAQPPEGWEAEDAQCADLDVFTQVRMGLAAQSMLHSCKCALQLPATYPNPKPFLACSRAPGALGAMCNQLGCAWRA